MGVPQGIEGVDLVELEIISKERLPAVSDDFGSCESLLHPWAKTQFSRSGSVGDYPDGPSAEWSELAGLLEESINQSKTNLDETAAAIKSFLNSILETDAGARDRMNQARDQMEGIGGG
jgi:hypothetical protein